MSQTVVITGGSSGIGRAAADVFAAAGYNVFELSRSGSDRSGVHHISADLTDEAAVKAAMEEVYSRAGVIDVLVNNAGNGVSGAVECISDQDTRRQFEVNLFGAMNAVRAALPYLRESRGRIIFISSAAAVFPIPFQAYYSASKAAVNSIAMALANELRPMGVQVCALMLGDVKTGFTAARRRVEDGSDIYGDAISRSVAVMERDEQSGIAPAAIAKVIVKMSKKRSMPVIRTVGMKYRLFALVARLAPYRLLNRVLYMMYGGK